ncbi:hypothetical protein UFOVP81_20 [uncultured Caudovirales phage]|uniref:Terminase-like family n=1 Tax=uncultured Caudovirales phage TaxID=2100421 RepID=A0A6J5L0G2_9CAUD|nr:hypothetical protein UFOVP81_20 [uncultured Caudovirales phage]
MSTNLLTKCAERWYPLKPHPVQEALITDNVRFKVVPAGRRSGKTERAKRFIVKEASRVVGKYFIAAPTRTQVGSIYWEDIKRLSFAYTFGDHAISETQQTVFLPNGSTITLIGLDKPQRMEGVAWTGGIVDEIADVKNGAWEYNISAALDTYNPNNPNHKAWCWLIGVPDGYNHYYDIYEHARTSGSPDWKVYHWYSSDILPPDIIEAAKSRLSPKQYRQEYEGSFENAGNKIYEDYGMENVTTETLKPHEQILWFHDFNFTPLSSGIGVIRKNSLYIVDEIVLSSAVSKESALEFLERYKNHENKSLLLYGDPAGRAGEKHAHPSDYTVMESLLRNAGWTVTRKVRGAAPPIKDRQNAVRAKICNANGERSLFVNAARASWCHRGLSTTQFKNGSTFLEADSPQQHITTAIGYCVHYEWPITVEKKDTHITNHPSLVGLKWNKTTY